MNRDCNDVIDSSHMDVYSSLNVKEYPARYLTLDLPMYIKRLFAQLRLANVFNYRIICNDEVYQFSNKDNCTIFHMLQVCPALNNLRTDFFAINAKPHSPSTWYNYFTSSNLSDIKKFCYFVSNLLKQRTILRNSYLN